MDFDEQEDQEEEIGIQIPTNFPTLGNSGRAGGEGASTATRKSGAGVAFRYRECLKNHAVTIGGNAVDGCGEFMPAGEEGTLDALRCAACNCHRNFHRKEAEGEGGFLHHSHQQHHHFQPFYHRPAPPSGYLHLTPTPHHQRPLALPSTSRDDEDISNPSSSGGGGGGGGGSGGSKKRFRTKFTAEQKEKMLAFSERVGWRIQKQDEAAVQQFCAEANVKRHVLKLTVPKTEVLSLSHTNTHYTGERECIKLMKMMMKDKSERIEAQTWLTCAKG